MAETDCKKCKHFVWCEFEKQAFHKITGIPCDEFEEKVTEVTEVG